MGITNLLTRQCTQTAVYWGAPVADGRGGFTYATPEDISCRWEQTGRILKSQQGEEYFNEAVVYVLQELEVEGALYLGSLDDLDSAPVPLDIETAYIIKSFEQLPSLGSTTDFVYKAYLGRGKG